MPEFSVTDLKDMPTLEQAQDADLKWRNEDTKVWLMRVGPEDGYYGPTVVVEKYNHRKGRWEEA